MTQETKTVLEKLQKHFKELSEAEGLMAKQFASKQNYNATFISDNRSAAFLAASNEVRKMFDRCKSKRAV